MADQNPSATAPQALEVPNKSGTVTIKDVAQQFFTVKDFGEKDTPKKIHVKLMAGNGKGDPSGVLVVDKFDKFMLSTTDKGVYVLTSENGSTLTLTGIASVRSSGDAGQVSLYNGSTLALPLPKGASTNLAYFDRTIDYVNKGPKTNVRFEGGAGIDIIQLPSLDGFTVFNKGEREGVRVLELRAKDGSVVALKGVEGVRITGVDGKATHFGCFTTDVAPIAKAVPLSNVAKPGETAACKR